MPVRFSASALRASILPPALFAGVVALALLLSSPAARGETRTCLLPRTEIRAEVRPDGSMHVWEERDYAFQGSFHHASRSISIPAGVAITGISVSEPDTPYRMAGGEEPGTYGVERAGDALTVDWYYSATDETRTFLLEYDVEGAVARHADCSELYWQFIGDAWDMESETTRVTIALPGAITKESIRAWAHGPLWGNIAIADSEVVLDCDPLPARTMLEVRLLLPRETVASSPRTDDASAATRIQSEEGRWAEQANRTRGQTKTALWAAAAFFLGVPLLLVIPGATLWLFLYLRYGREWPARDLPHYLPEAPYDWTPAQLGWLWRWSYLGVRDMTAATLDLVRRGALRIVSSKGVGDATGYALARAADFRGELTAADRYLLDELLFGEFAGADVLDLEQFRAAARRHPQKSQARFLQWRALARAECQGLVLDDPVSKRMSYLGLAIGIAMAGLGFPLLLLLNPFGLVVGLIGLGLALGSRVIRRRGREAADAFHRWEAFRRYLVDFSTLKEHPAPSVILWEKYLIYAVSLGVADRVISQLRALYPQLPDAGPELPAFSQWVVGSGAAPLQALEAVSSAVSSLGETLAIASSSESSSSGAGGGFSGTGGGVGGGGGGGGGGSVD